jgi:hypothetical protein
VAAGGGSLIYAADQWGDVHRWNGSSWTTIPAPAGSSGLLDIRAMALAQGPSGATVIGLVGGDHFVSSIGPTTTTQTPWDWRSASCSSQSCTVTPHAATALPGRAEVLFSGDTWAWRNFQGTREVGGVGVIDGNGASNENAPCAECTIEGLVALGTATQANLTALTKSCDLYTGHDNGTSVYGWLPARTAILGGTSPWCEGLQGHATSGLLARDAHTIAHLATADAAPDDLLAAPSGDAWAGLGVRPDGKFLAVTYDGLARVWTPGAGWASSWEQTGLAQVRAVNSAPDGTIVVVGESGELAVRAP